MRPLQTYRKQAFFPMTAYLPVVRREGSISALRAAAVRRLRSETRLRAQCPLLAALRPTATIPPASLSYKCARAARTPYLLFIIYYLLSIIYFTAPVKPLLPHYSPETLPRPKNAPPGRFCPAVR